jgi:V8-like Glu-specific endopeptidase
MKALWVATLILLIGTVSDGAAKAQRALPDDNLAYPVLITLGGATGSGFFINNGVSVFFVTAKHVLFDPSSGKLRSDKATLLSYSPDISDTKHNRLTLNLSMMSASGDVKAHPTEDVAVVKIGTISDSPPLPPVGPLTLPTPSASAAATTPTAGRFNTTPDVTVDELSATGLLSVDAQHTIKMFDKVLVGNEVVMFGYPTSLALLPNPKIDFSRPLLRKGIVAGENVPQHSIILDCPSYQGDSGGPVIEVDSSSPFQRTFSIIGVMSAFVPFADTWKNEHFGYSNTTLQNSGYSVITPMDFVMELLH